VEFRERESAARGQGENSGKIFAKVGSLEKGARRLERIRTRAGEDRARLLHLDRLEATAPTAARRLRRHRVGGPDAQLGIRFEQFSQKRHGQFGVGCVELLQFLVAD
jgi:hypothetical protein